MADQSENSSNNVNKTTLQNENIIKSEIKAEVHDTKPGKELKSVVFDLSLNKAYPNKSLTGKLLFKNVYNKFFVVCGNIAFTTDKHTNVITLPLPEPMKVDYPYVFEGYCHHEPSSDNLKDNIETIKFIYKDTQLSKLRRSLYSEILDKANQISQHPSPDMEYFFIFEQNSITM